LESPVTVRTVASLRVSVVAKTACWYTPVLAYGASEDASIEVEPGNTGNGLATTVTFRASTIWMLTVAVTEKVVKKTFSTPVPYRAAD